MRQLFLDVSGGPRAWGMGHACSVLSCLVLSCPALAKELSNLPRSVMLCLGLWSVLFGLWPLENSALAPWGMVWFGFGAWAGYRPTLSFSIFPFRVTSRAMDRPYHGMGFLQKNTTPVLSLVLSFVNLVLILIQTRIDFVAIAG